MTTEPIALSEEALLAELGWVRGLALSLVRDPAVAEDIVQDACLVALERPPREVRGGAGLRAWLASVTRSLARGRVRGESRRRRRETAASRPERDDTDLVEAVALRRDVVAAVLALEEPHRTTLLRYHFEERNTREMAELAGISEAAVRQRLVRARAALREQLADVYGDEHGWIRALAPLFVEPDVSLWRRASPLLLTVGGVAAAWLFVVASGGYGAAGELDSEPTQGGSDPEPTNYAYQPQPQVTPEIDFRDARRRGGLARWMVAPEIEARPAVPSRSAVQTAGLLSSSAGRRDAEDLAARLSQDLAREISNVREVKGVPRKLFGQVAKHSGQAAALVREARLYDVSYLPRGAEELLACRVIEMPLDEDWERRIVVLAEEGYALTMAVWGGAAFDEDPDRRWGVFQEQMMRVQRGGEALSFSRPSEPEMRELIDELAAGLDEDRRLSRWILAQRITMASNAMISRATRSLERAGKGPSPVWFTLVAQRYRGLTGAAEDFAAVLGDEQAQTHAELSLVAAEAFDAYSEALASGDEARVAVANKRRSDACRSCHQTASEDGADFFDAFDPWVEGLELPQGVAYVEYDLAPALGDDGVTSRKLATAFRAALLLSNETP